jgi:hypothetical protein
VDTADWQALLDVGLKPSFTLDQWRMRGAESLTALPPGLTACLFSIDLLGGAEFWFGFDNFYALLQYNRSRNYAMAVHDVRDLARTGGWRRLAVCPESFDALRRGDGGLPARLKLRRRDERSLSIRDIAFR